jgi:serine phosphatase RsbU (regulator of sigma subunit)
VAVAADGTVTEVLGPPTLPLGLGATPVLCTGRLDAGDRLLLYTDGLLEARDESRAFVDPWPILRPLTHSGFDAVLDDVLTGLLAKVGGALTDDLALLVAEYRGRSEGHADLASD